MKCLDGTIYLSATDLVGHLNCNRLTELNVQVATGQMDKPDNFDPLLEILRERGHRHEQAYFEHLKSSGCDIVVIEGVDIDAASLEATIEAMQEGREIIAQAALLNDRWRGRADFLRRIQVPSILGSYSYEIIDTKLARETKGGTVLQLCLYAEMLGSIQGIVPEYVYVIAPWSDFADQKYRVDDYYAYYRTVKLAAENNAIADIEVSTYPDPKPHCDICSWQSHCEARRRDDDHLCLVANISKNQISELQNNGYDTLQKLGEIDGDVPFVPLKGSIQALERTKGQAKIQLLGRTTGTAQFELLDIIPEFGLAALPEPSLGDIFFDIESDQFVGENGLEYLFGYCFHDEDGGLQYVADWAFDMAKEKAMFERFIAFVSQRRSEFPDMHIYHFGAYEQSALKRLMGRYASCENEVDNLLRGRVMIDLLSVVRNGIRASVESYSLKKLEPFYEFEREVKLRDANIALTKLSSGLELDDVQSIDEPTKLVVQGYNSDDCVSTLELRDWLEAVREEQVTTGEDIPRPAPGQDGPSEEISEQQARVQALIAQLILNLPIDPSERTAEQQAIWILAHIIDWHRRELKAVYWEGFRLQDLSAVEMANEKTAISGLTHMEVVGQTPTGIPVDRYLFEPQDSDIRGGERVFATGGEALGSIVNISFEENTVDIKKTKKTALLHPDAFYAHTVIKPKDQAAALFRLGQYVAENGILGDGEYRAARDLLLKIPLNTGDEAFQNSDENTLEAGLRLTHLMNGGILPIQGPPGTGKSYTGARMICELVKAGKSVGITANSHKVIRNLLDEVIDAAPTMGVDINCAQKPETGNKEEDGTSLQFIRDNEKLIASVNNGDAQVAAATPFFWARKDVEALVDVLFVDEAGQMSLANALAISGSAETIVLLGDPQQLEQPIKGSHPDGTEVSALDHLIGTEQTISVSQGLFLETSYRMAPEIRALDSELFYNGKLESVAGCELHEIRADGIITGSGLRYLPVPHIGNTSSSVEEAETVAHLVAKILGSNPGWVDRKGVERIIELKDILIIAPYNAQVFEIKKLIPDAKVGTVDKFQGQEAPIAIYSMATSSHSDAPRGMEFLYSANRFNVAISRAKCVSVLVASPNVFEAECRTPRQMQLANAFCRFLEVSELINL